MPKVSPIQSNFGSGEFSPLLEGRVDLDRYKSAMKTCLNYFPTAQGGLTRRPGTKFVAEVKTSSKATRLVSFEFSVTQAYIIEFGDQYIRFYKDNGRIEVATVPTEVATPYLEADLFQLRFTQSADVMYIVHPDYAPRKLTRTSHTAWTLTEIEFIDGPYMPVNAESTTLTPGGTTGTVTLTASSIVGINGGVGFKATDVGRSVRLQSTSSSDWGWAKITVYTSVTLVDIEIQQDFASIAATAFWHLGTWSDTTGYPAVVVFHEDRLGFAGATDFPQRIDLSETSEYESFSPTEYAIADGTIATNALSFTFNAQDVNAVRWALSDEKGLLVGTVGGEWMVRPSDNGEALSPTNITAKRSTTYGSANTDALQVGKAGIFMQRSGKKLREISYSFDVDGFRANDLTILAEHVTESGVTELAKQREPQPIVWATRTDGVLIGITYERDPNTFKAGWHRHIIGGSSDAAGTAAKVESVAVIPSADETRDELWVVVQRYVDGAVVRHVEYMTRVFEDEVDQKDAFFLDSGLTYDSPVTVSGATLADPCVITATSHGFSDGDKVLFAEVLGMDELNDSSYLVSNKTTHTFEITTLAGVDIDSSAYTTYVSGGEVRKYVTAISGLTHLEGETINILGDGAVQPAQAVSSGAITLTVAATTIHIGLGYNSDGELLRIEAGAADGTSIGKTRRTHNIGMMFHRSLGIKIGYDKTNLTEMTFRTTSDYLGRAPALFSGILHKKMDAKYDFENRFYFRQDQPLPSTILAIMPQMNTQDR